MKAEEPLFGLMVICLELNCCMKIEDFTDA